MQGKAGLWFRRASGVCLLLGAWQLASLFFPPLGSLAAGRSLFPAAGGAPHCPGPFHIG